MVAHSILLTMGDKTDLLAVIYEECSLHPRMTVGDLQKLVYQGTFGGDHGMHDRSRFLEALRGEWDGLRSEVQGEPSVLQVIDPDRQTARLHLRPCKSRGVSFDALCGPLLVQPLKKGRRERFDALWIEAIRLAQHARIPFDPDTLASLAFPSGLPHHSRSYGPAAYRIVNDITDPKTRADLSALGLLP